ncbi:type VI secretion system tip protein TssI/VgrG [Aquabacterium sp. A7-Y]|uniref:type VI secretion system Vgr family protein n=1 Tax=Aquabacterium sp. A7-Y TaxID=1349605 RepID=UPI00223D472A|nr:type VI secretion system tip protein TssI/VgrG [Aquabacterium sp. A7-Y]MCW7541896.1 type VI secretion system tip protein TssI/VgrG [Aquabacterium sp. A7-Y]
MDVLAELTTPLGDGALFFYRMQAVEVVSQPFDYTLELLAETPDVAFKDLIGQPLGVTLHMHGRKRYFHGLVTRFQLVGRHSHYFRYEARVRPWLWVLSRTHDCRIFQEKNTLEIVKEVFADHSVSVVEDRTTGSYESWDYCVQYRESDLQFVSRLLEHEGIYYFFEHRQGQHTLVLADGPSAHEKTPGYEQVAYKETEGTERTDREAVRTWRVVEEMLPGKTAVSDFDFERPSVSLLQQRAAPRSHPQADHEVYDYPGEYTQADRGEQFVRTRLEELQCRYQVAQATTDARGVSCGAIFDLTGFDRQDQNTGYLITGTRIELLQEHPESPLSDGSSFHCSFDAIPSSEPFRPVRSTPRSVVQGPQTAIVVGPAGDEIYTDKYGRVKVQFHWDRYGKRDANSSCWVRVSQPWAGKNFGFMAIPRIGQEVIVDFLEGDPNRPIITGRVYNAEQMPPWALPANATQTGILTRSSKGGSGANANELRFEDKKGSEQVYLHAEKNQDIEVENDETHWVGHDRTKTIDHDETVHVKHDRTETVDNNETITIGVDRTEKVGANETVSIGANRTKQVGMNDSLTVGANQTYGIAANQTGTVGASRTTAVALNDALAVGLAQEIAIGAAQVVAIGAAQTTTIGALQDITVGASQSVSVGTNQSVSVGAKLSTEVGSDETRSVGGTRATSVAEDDGLSVGKKLVIEAGDSITLRTGKASLTMKKDGTITIKGADITLDGSGKINAKASKDVVIKGSKVLNN